MKTKPYYEIIQLAVEKIKETENVVTEIRFLHCLDYNEDGEDKREELLYVVPLNYNETDKFIIYDESLKKNKKLLFKIIEKTLGKEQIEHMTNLLKESHSHKVAKTQKKQYINL